MTRIKKFNSAILVLVSAAILSGCALGKMIKLASQQDLQVDPNPLELHAGKVPFTMSAVLPPKMLASGKVYSIKNFYQYGDKEIELGEIEFKAEDFPNGSTTTSRKSASFEFNYMDEMNPGKIVIQGIAKDPRNGKQKTTPKMDVAPGIITTSSAVKDNYLAAYAPHGYNDKEELVPTNVNFYFEQGRSVLRANLSTDGTSNRTKQNNLSAFIADKNVTRTVTITGTHSPEGSETINTNLSNDRAKVIEDYYRRQMKRYDYKGAADSIKFILKPIVQDWAAFKLAISTYDGIDVSTKTEWSRIINGTGTFVDKEKQLRKSSAYKKVFNEIYPSLRSAKTEILTVKPKKSPAQISVLAKQIVGGSAKPDTLSLEEMMYAATLTPSLSEKAGIYMAATKKGGTWQAHNNLAATYLSMAIDNSDNRAKMVQDALTQLEIAAKKKKSAEVMANMGSALVMQKKYAEAAGALSEAAGSASNELKANINGVHGPIQIRNAEYGKAKATLNGASNSAITNFNRGLAALLTKDWDNADDYFENIVDSSIGAEASYYRAVVAARANRSGDVVSNLKAAVGKDASLKDKALADLEFSKFADAVAQAVR